MATQKSLRYKQQQKRIVLSGIAKTCQLTIDDIADLIDTGGFTVDQAISVGTRMAPTGVDILEVERLRPLFIQYQQHTVTVPQIKAQLLGSQQ
jgi:hypothetical protein